jgi:hypothetical protein
MRALAVTAIATSLLACAPPATAPQRTFSLDEWRTMRKRLDDQRDKLPGARTDRITLELTEPQSGRVLRARGAVAIDPPRALRMILLGPGGSTALDLWIEGERYRFAVPAIDLVKRGSLRGPREERRGLPVDFLAWWLLRPLDGDLQWYASADRFLLADRGAMIDLAIGDHVEATRASLFASAGGPPRVERETVEAQGFGCSPNQRVTRYRQASTGLDVRVACEGSTPGAPPARALADPDQEAR